MIWLKPVKPLKIYSCQNEFTIYTGCAKKVDLKLDLLGKYNFEFIFIGYFVSNCLFKN